MNILALLIKLLPVIVQLMGLAEKAFADKPESGAEKKALVMDITGALVAGAESVFTGGAAETWASIKDPVGSIIDSAASIAFPNADPNDPKYTTGA